MSVFAPPQSSSNFPLASPLLTWEAYLNEGETVERYDIIEGVRRYMASPTWNHQEVVMNAGLQFLEYQRRTARGRTMIAPFDVLIQRIPRLQVRQPDVLFISNNRLNAGGGIPAKGPLTIAPEIVVEVLSDSDRLQVLEGKLADYTSIGVAEAWLLRPDDQIAEVVTLSATGTTRAGLYGSSDTAQSATFPDLQTPVISLFQL